MAYFCHAGQWWEVTQLLPLEECPAEIRSRGLFTPKDLTRLLDRTADLNGSLL